MSIGYLDLPKQIEVKITSDVFNRVNKKMVAEVLAKIEKDNPNLQVVLSHMKTIYVIRKKETYHMLMDEFLDKVESGPLTKDNFYRIYPFEKPEGYSIRGLCLDKERNILVNLHQLFQCADEYATYLSSDETVQKRDYRYFAKDCHYDNFNNIIRNKYEAVNFLFWNTLFQQLRALQQSIQTVDLKEYGYDLENSATVNDMIGFAKHMYKHYVTTEKPIE